MNNSTFTPDPDYFDHAPLVDDPSNPLPEDFEDGPDPIDAWTAEAEIRAEFGMSYVSGGGRPEDVSAAYWQFGGAR